MPLRTRSFLFGVGFLSFGLWLFPGSALAAPAISGTSGTWNHDGSVTISGSSFGTKSPAAPVMWDHGQYANLTAAGWSGAWPFNSDCGSLGNTAYSTGSNGVVMPHARTSKYITGSHCGGVGYDNGQNVLVYKSFTKSEGMGLYANWYVRFNPAWVGGNVPPNDGNLKTIDYALNGPYDASNWYFAAFFDAPQSDAQYIITDDGSSLQNPDANGHGAFYGNMVSPAKGTVGDASKWVKNEFVMKVTNQTGLGPGGKALIYDNGVLGANYYGKTDSYSGTSRVFAFGGYNRDYGSGNDNNRRFFADLYFDTTMARAVLCEGSTYASRGKCEPQIPTSWSATSIGVTVNAGRFTNGTTAYLYVCDSADSCNATGTSIVIASGGGDTTAPVLSGGLPTGALAAGTTSTTMQVTTDENATCKYATSAGTAYASMPSTFSTTGGTTHSVTVSGLTDGGSYTRYVRCSDTSGNANTSDYTISWTVASGGAGPVTMNECANPPAGAVFCEDFDTGSANDTQRRAKWDDYDGAMDVNFPVDTGPSQTAGNHVAQFRVASGVSGGADLVQVFSSTYDKLYTRWYVKYETGFNFNAPLHGGGLALGSRSYLGSSGNQPTGSDFAYFNIQHQNGTPFHNALYAYSYYPGMYQDCGGPGSCYGDSLPCVYDNGSNYCTNAAHRPQGTPPSVTDGAWYCVESMVNAGTTGATGEMTLWLDGTQLTDITGMSIRSTTSLKIENLWLSLYHHDGTHSTQGMLFDNVVVGTQRISCGSGGDTTAPAPPSGLAVQ